eukprot:TRINITY_DN2761_c0_g1_i9.p1 TRINITY_DN2761_c0_g1~~TRINITY_DN2761_c0_g1_i9.p1  ORF type:complete len:238 (+),score=56.89 TRINITY_DN2761_c0_g1_i9:182-895(+)
MCIRDRSDHAGADTPRDGPGLAYGPNHPHTPKLDPKSSLKLVPVVEPPTSSKKPAAIPLSARLKKSFNAPSIMAIFAIILGLITPIRSEFFVDDAVARPAFTDAIERVGKAYLAGIFLTLGGNLFVQIQGNLSEGPPTKVLVGVLLARLVCAPMLSYGIVMLLWHGTGVFGGDKLLAYVLLLESAGPTAVSLTTICQYFDNHEQFISVLLLYQYAVVLFTLTGWNTVFLMSLDASSV